MNVDFIKQAVGAPITKSPLRVQHKDIAAALKRAAGTGDAMPSNVRNSWSGKGVKVDTSKLFDKESGWLVKAAIDFLRPAVGSGAGSSATPAVGVLFKKADETEYTEEPELSDEAQREILKRNPGMFEKNLGAEQAGRLFGPGGAVGWGVYGSMPIVGTGLMGYDAIQSARQGDVPGAALNAGFSAAGIPLAANAAKGMAAAGAGAITPAAALGFAARVPGIAALINTGADVLDTGRGYFDARNPGQTKADRLLNAFYAVGHKNLAAREPGAGWMSHAGAILSPYSNVLAMQAANADTGRGWDAAKRMADRARASMSQGGPVNEASKAQMQRLHDRIKQESGRGIFSRMFGGTQKWTAAPQPAKG